MKFSVKAGLALAVSAAFIATSAPVFAASQVDFSGFYRAKFHTLGNTGSDGFVSEGKQSDTWFANRFRLNMDVQATDEISVHARWQGPNDKKWGQDQGDMTVKYAYGQVKQDWGTIQVGRLNDQDGIGHAGLKLLGWDPTSVDGDEENYRPFDTGNGGDGINYFNTWDNGFSFEAAYLKMKSKDRIEKKSKWHDDPDDKFDYGNDRDFDRYQAEARYAWDTGAASLAVMYDRDAYGDSGVYKDGAAPDYAPNTSTTDDYTTASVWYINPAFMQGFGAFSTHAEAMFGFGKYNGFEKTATDKRDDKISGQGFYIDFDYNYGPGRVNLAGWWTSGTEYTDKANGKQKTLPDGMGQGFNPLLVLYDGGALEAANDGQADAFSNSDYETWRGNHWAIDLNGQHAFTDEITARWAIAYAGLNKANFGKKAVLEGENGGSVYLEDQDKDLGWEIDFGVDAEILDNLHLYSGFGYLFAGDAFNKTAVLDDGNGNITKVKSEGDDGYAWINTLYFNF